MSKPYCIDSHFHFDSFVEAGTQDEIVRSALEADVKKLVAIGGSEEANRIAIDMHDQYSDNVFAVVGYDRDEAGKPFDAEALRSQLKLPGVVGIGETGLDYHYTPDTAKEQMALFENMLEMAVEVSKPVVVHSREADDDTLKLLRDYVDAWKPENRPPGVLHCFTGNLAFAQALYGLGFMISFSGILTFKNAKAIQEVAKVFPLDRIMIETDSPYLAPHPHRGKSNQPAWVVHVAKYLARIRDEPVDDVMRKTTDNAEWLFGI